MIKKCKVNLKNCICVFLFSTMILSIFIKLPLTVFAADGGIGYTIAQTFPDPNMAAAVAAELGTTTDHVIVQSDIDSRKGLDLIDRNISDITGIQYFTNLDLLWLSTNNISDLSPLTGLTNLKILNINNNQVSDLTPLANLTNLNYLTLDNVNYLKNGNNHVSDLYPLKGLINLGYLSFSNNQVSDINPLENLTNINILYCDNNQISNLNSLTNFKSLCYLFSDNNQVSNLSPLAGLTNLKYLNISGNHISDLSPLTGLTNLISFTITEQSIQLPMVTTGSSLSIVNTIKFRDGSIVTPETISNSGSYTAPNTNWVNLPSDTTQVSYTFSKFLDSGVYTGTVYQPITFEYNMSGTNRFTFDGNYTYYIQADGTTMKDRMTYHPDGEHIIYFDVNGHELFNTFQYCPNVGYTCYFDSNGYLYKDKITFVNNKPYYLDGDGRMRQTGWFQFANGVDYGYANGNGTLMSSGFSYDPWGRVVFYHWNGMVARGLISDGQWYYNMSTTDGHYLGQFPVH